MKTTLLALALLAGCGSEAAVVSAGDQAADGGVITDAGAPQSNGGSDAGSPPPADSGSPPPADAGVPSALNWVRDSAISVYGTPFVVFHSSQPGDLWLEESDSGSHEGLYQRVAGAWVSMFQAFVRTTTVAWVRSPAEAWILEGSTIHIVGRAGNRDLVLPSGKYYSTIGDGWIAYFQPGQTVPAHCSSFTNDPGVVGFLRVTDSGFVDLPLPNLCSRSLPTDIYMGTAVSEVGDVLSWNGSTWELTAQLHGGGADTFGLLSGSAPDDLYLIGGMEADHFDGTTWKAFNLMYGDLTLRAVSAWARPWGPKWANGGDIDQFAEGIWQDRGRPPGSENAGFAQIGSDGTDVFVTGGWVPPSPAGSPPYSISIYRYSP